MFITFIICCHIISWCKCECCIEICVVANLTLCNQKSNTKHFYSASISSMWTEGIPSYSSNRLIAIKHNTMNKCIRIVAP